MRPISIALFIFALLCNSLAFSQDNSIGMPRLTPQVIAEMNEANRRVSRHWLLEYQRTEDLFRVRVVENGAESVVSALRKVMNEIGLAVLGWDSKSSELVAENYGPNPLSIDEWKVVIEQEETEARKVGGPFFVFATDPKEYLVQLRIKVVKLGDDRTVIVLDYIIDAPRYRRIGLVPTSVAPPSAVRYASLKIWALLDSRLIGENRPKTRKRFESEKLV